MSQISTFQSQVGVPAINQPLPTGGGIAQGLASAGQSVGRGLMDMGQAQRAQQERTRLEREQVQAVARKNQKIRYANDLRLKIAKLAADAAAKENPTDWFMANAESLRSGLEEITDLELREAVELDLDTMLTTTEAELYGVHKMVTLAQADLAIKGRGQEIIATLGGGVVKMGELQSAIDSHRETLNEYVGTAITKENAEAQQQSFVRRAIMAQYRAHMDSKDPWGAAYVLETLGRDAGIDPEEISRLKSAANQYEQQIYAEEVQSLASGFSQEIPAMLADSSVPIKDVSQYASDALQTLGDHQGLPSAPRAQEAIENAIVDTMKSAAETGTDRSKSLLDRSADLLPKTPDNVGLIAKAERRWVEVRKTLTEQESMKQMGVAAALRGEYIPADPATLNGINAGLIGLGWTPANRAEYWAANERGMPSDVVKEIGQRFNPASGASGIVDGYEMLTAVERGGGMERAKQMIVAADESRDVAQTAFYMMRGASTDAERERIASVLSGGNVAAAIQAARTNLDGNKDVKPVSASAVTGTERMTATARDTFDSRFMYEYARLASEQDISEDNEAVRDAATYNAVSYLSERYGHIQVTTRGFDWAASRLWRPVIKSPIELSLISGSSARPTEDQARAFIKGNDRLMDAGNGDVYPSSAFRFDGAVAIPLVAPSGEAQAFGLWRPSSLQYEVVTGGSAFDSLVQKMKTATDPRDTMPGGELRWRPQYGGKAVVQVDVGIAKAFYEQAEQQFFDAWGKSPDPANPKDKGWLYQASLRIANQHGWRRITPETE